MSEVKITTVADAPEEGKAKKLVFDHPVTETRYELALFRVDGRYYAITNECKRCGGGLTEGILDGMYVICPRDETPWHVRTGLCRFNRTSSLPTYKVRMENEDLIITI